SSASATAPPPAVDEPLPPASFCPPDTASVAGAYCVDRFEGMLVDLGTGARISPDFPTTPGMLDYALSGWATERERAGNVLAHALPLPLPPLLTSPTPRVISHLGVR